MTKQKFITFTAVSIAVILVTLSYITYIFYDVTDKIDTDWIITIGQDNIPECQVHVRKSVWGEMNRMGIYRWVVACENTKLK